MQHNHVEADFVGGGAVAVGVGTSVVVATGNEDSAAAAASFDTDFAVVRDTALRDIPRIQRIHMVGKMDTEVVGPEQQCLGEVFYVDMTVS